MGNLGSEMDFMLCFLFFFSAGRPGKPGVFYREEQEESNDIAELL